MSVETLLTDAFAILADGSAWTQGANARDVDGKPVPILSPNAEKWDAFGALQRALYANGSPVMRDFHGAYGAMRDRIPTYFKGRDIEKWNDSATSFAELSIIFPSASGVFFALATQSDEILVDEGETFFFAIE